MNSERVTYIRAVYWGESRARSHVGYTTKATLDSSLRYQLCYVYATLTTPELRWVCIAATSSTSHIYHLLSKRLHNHIHRAVF